MKFCANLSFMFTEAPTIVERYALAKNAGFKAVESGFPIGHTLEEVKEAKDAAGIEQVLMNLRTDAQDNGGLGVTALPGKENEFKDNLNVTIHYAKAVGARKIHIMAGKYVTGGNWDVYESNLRYAASVLKNENIVGLIEPINKYSVPNYFLHDYDRAVSILTNIGSPHLKLQLDVFHMQQIIGDLTHNITNLMPHVGHIQIAQVPDRNEPDTPGEVNYKYILKHIEKCGYTDWIGLEYKPAKGSKEGLKWINEFGYSL